MSDDPTIFEELEALPDPARPGLTFVTVAVACEEGARDALSMAADGKPERARGALEFQLMDLLPPKDLDTPDAWARRGAHAGAVCAWGAITGTVPQYRPPTKCPSTIHATCHYVAWLLAANTVMGVRYE